jgi:hypothetical protein
MPRPALSGRSRRPAPRSRARPRDRPPRGGRHARRTRAQAGRRPPSAAADLLQPNYLHLRRRRRGRAAAGGARAKSDRRPTRLPAHIRVLLTRAAPPRHLPDRRSMSGWKVWEGRRGAGAGACPPIAARRPSPVGLSPRAPHRARSRTASIRVAGGASAGERRERAPTVPPPCSSSPSRRPPPPAAPTPPPAPRRRPTLLPGMTRLARRARMTLARRPRRGSPPRATAARPLAPRRPPSTWAAIPRSSTPSSRPWPRRRRPRAGAAAAPLRRCRPCPRSRLRTRRRPPAPHRAPGERAQRCWAGSAAGRRGRPRPRRRAAAAACSRCAATGSISMSTQRCVREGEGER